MAQLIFGSCRHISKRNIDFNVIFSVLNVDEIIKINFQNQIITHDAFRGGNQKM